MSRRGWFTMLIAIWVLAVPLTAAAILLAVHLAGPNILKYGVIDTVTPSFSVGAKLSMVVAIWASFYIFVGWIPLIVIHATVPKGNKAKGGAK